MAVPLGDEHLGGLTFSFASAAASSAYLIVEEGRERVSRSTYAPPQIVGA